MILEFAIESVLERGTIERPTFVFGGFFGTHVIPVGSAHSKTPISACETDQGIAVTSDVPEIMAAPPMTPSCLPVSL